MQNSLTLRQQIKAKIAETRKKETGDYESLIRQVDNEHRKINLNLPQAVANTSQALIKVLEWGRGTGKTTYWGAHLNSILREMPRSSGVIPSATYKDMLTHIIPSLIQGLELFGLYEGLHYFIGEKPPRAWRNSWGTAYQPPKRNDHYITFWNGTGAHLLSQDIKGDGRGLNADWSAADEAAKLDGQRLQEEVEPTLRGTNVAAFKKSRLFGSRLFSTSVALTQEGTWYQKYEDLAAYDSKKYTFIKATSEHNRANLREGFLEEAEATAYSAWVFNAEYKNIRPNMVKNGFYALLDLNRHAYNAYNYNFLNKVGQDANCQIDEDLVKGVPIIISMDFGAVINSLTVNQYLKSINEYRTLKSFFVLGDDKKIQDDLIADFHKYYQSHQATNPDIFFWYDNSGNVRTGITRITRAEQVRDQLQKLGWKPRLMTTGGSNPQHESKYLLWLQILGEKDPRYPKYRINKGNCRELWISMSHAKIKRSSTGLIQKDKSVEKSTRIQRQEATDLSDANDTAIFGMFSHLNSNFGGYLPDFAVTIQ